MISQLYVKSNDNLTSLIISNDKGNIYYHKVLDSTEFAVIQRGASFIKHELDSDIVEMYLDKVKFEEITNDNYIKWCNISFVKGENPNQEIINQCLSNLSIYQRWNMMKGKENE